MLRLRYHKQQGNDKYRTFYSVSAMTLVNKHISGINLLFAEPEKRTLLRFYFF